MSHFSPELSVSVSVGGASTDSAVVSQCSGSDEPAPQTEASPPCPLPSKSTAYSSDLISGSYNSLLDSSDLYLTFSPFLLFPLLT